MKYIDINCDVGEGIGNEASLFPLISSCNIACGGHAGDTDTMRAIIQMAQKEQVKIGAHPSYPDKANFGRVSMPMEKGALQETIQEQLENFVEILENHNGVLHHIKPHGALYNDIAKDKILAQCFLEAITSYKNRAYVYVPYKSVVADLASKQGFKIKREAFGDRNYNKDLSLVSRTRANAMVHDPEEVLQHILRMTNKGMVKTVNNETVEILADTFCIHGDTPSALEILTYLSERLSLQNIVISK